MNKIFVIFLLPLAVLSQEVLITQLPDNINTNSAEINFIKKNDSTAYFTVITATSGKIESNIYTVNFTNGEWRKRTYTKYNSDTLNTANIFFLNDGRTFLTKCNNEMLDCKIIFLEENKEQVFYDISAISSNQFFNTQPFVSKHQSQKALYFVSDRKGGFGGLDIWLSIIDNNGKFGIPINAGSKINSVNDEITPFYNKHEGTMYFSSNRKNGLGGFDIYKSEGRLNLWREPENVEELNTKKDDLYLTFYDEKSGYFSSNRVGSKFQNTEYCCNDIFSFEYLPSSNIDTNKATSEIHDYLPLDLYFHNDEPDPNTTKTTTKKTYKESYTSYFMMKPDYEKNNPNTNIFFEETLLKNFNILNKVLEMLVFDLKKGNNMELQIRGYASPLHNHVYNQKLSQRRISSFMNYLVQFKQGDLKEYISSEKLIITKLPFGESNASDKVSDDSNDKKKSVYSIEAMLERKIEIVDIILKH